jgi:hypothetical protein
MLGDRGETPNVAKKASDVAAMGLEQVVFALGDDEICHLRRQKLLEASEPIDLVGLAFDFELQTLI